MAFDTLSDRVRSNAPPPPIQPTNNPKFQPLDSEPSQIGTNVPPSLMIHRQPTASDYPKFPPLDLNLTGMMDSCASVCILWSMVNLALTLSLRLIILSCRWILPMTWITWNQLLLDWVWTWRGPQPMNKLIPPLAWMLSTFFNFLRVLTLSVGLLPVLVQPVSWLLQLLNPQSRIPIECV